MYPFIIAIKRLCYAVMRYICGAYLKVHYGKRAKGVTRSLFVWVWVCLGVSIMGVCLWFMALWFVWGYIYPFVFSVLVIYGLYMRNVI